MSILLLVMALALVVVAALYFAGVRGRAMTLAAAATLMGCAGYCLQGHTELPGAPALGEAAHPPVPLTGPRQAFFGQFNSAERWLIMSDAFASRGNTQDAAGIIQTGLKFQPQNVELWTAYGNALADHANGMINPAAEFAYERAEALAPNYPGPLFFHGLALGRSGQREIALQKWRRALALSPENASWVPGLRLAIAEAGGRLSARSSDSPAASSHPSTSSESAQGPAGSQSPTP